MAEFTPEEMGLSFGGEGFPRVSPEQQRVRDVTADWIKRGERTGYEGFIPTSAVVEGSQPRNPAKVQEFSPAEMGLEFAPTVSERAKGGVQSFGEPLRPQAEPTFSLLRPTDDDKERPARGQSFTETPGGAATARLQQPGKRPGRQAVSPAEFAASAVGTAAQVSDMFTSVGKQVLGAATYWGARAGTRLGGASAQESADAAAAAKDWFFPPEISTPWAKVAERLGPAAIEAYHNNPVAWIFGQVGKTVEKGAKAAATESGMQTQDYLALADQLMGSMLWKQVRPGVQDAFKAKVDAAKGARTGNWSAAPPKRALPPGREAEPIEGTATRVPETPPAEPKQLPDWTKALGVGAAAYAGAELSGQDAMDSLLLGAAALSVKAKGGMWHPKAAEVLSNPLAQRITANMRPEGDFGPGNAGVQARGYAALALAAPATAWANKASSTYLNRYMGTEADPLRDVEIPYAEGPAGWHIAGDPRAAADEGMKKWGEVTAALVSHRTAQQHQALQDRTGASEIPFPERIPPNEKVWELQQAAGTGESATQAKVNAAARALRGYLSHVGDYLRENVDPAKLPQYDLVRAVKETTKRDAEMAKAMEREAAASSADLPVHKDYGDGYRWVELKKPERLTPDQMKSVAAVDRKFLKEHSSPEVFRDHLNALRTELGREPTDAELRESMHEEYEAFGEPATFLARDAEGRVITNNYTEKPAGGGTPEEAWLAGQLAREGNQMGHCVGGYCEPVASGEARIFSLRDGKGKSHVTVEVEPKGTERILSDDAGTEWGAAEPAALDNILQIKGKQNRAPAAEYLPYVQDFVKSGKWGEVGDLEGTGLTLGRDVRGHTTAEGKRLNADELRHAGIEPDKFYTAEEVGKIARGERGSIDPKLLARLALATAGAAAGAAYFDDPVLGAVGGAVAGALLPHVIRATTESRLDVAKLAEQTLGLVSTRLSNASPAIRLRAVALEKNIAQRPHQYFDQSHEFFDRLNGLRGQAKLDAERAILNEGPNGFAGPGAKEVRDILSTLGGELRDLARFKAERAGYFPRVVKDLEGLKEALGGEVRPFLEQKLRDAEAKSVKSRNRGLSDLERSRVVDEFLRTQAASRGQPGFTQRRTVGEITPELQKFYLSPTDSFHQYVRSAVEDIELAKFFGRDQRNKVTDDGSFLDLDASAGALVDREMTAGRLTPEAAEEVRHLLQVRYMNREAPTGFVQDVKNITNLGLLGNFASGAVQAGDSVMTVYAHGLKPTMVAVARKLTGTMPITGKDFGLFNHVAEEFVSTKRSAAMLQQAFKYSFFSSIDRLGKDLQINASLAKYQNWARSARGTQRIEAKYGEALGAEMPLLLEDLRAGNLSDRVQTLLFAELSDMQPISRLEMPEAYLANPNGRILYQLKTFMLKQIDIARRDAYNEIKAGNRARGLKNLGLLGLALGVSGVPGDLAKDFLFGRDVDLEPEDIAMNAAKTFGWSQFTMDEAKRNPWGTVGKTLMPPLAIWQMMDNIIRGDGRAWRYLPLVGPIIYNRYYGGNERAEIARKRKTGEALSPEAETYKETRRAERLLRQLESR